VLVVILIVGCVDDGGDTTYSVSSLLGEKKLYLGMVEKRILTPIEELLAFHDERRNPPVITGVDTPWKGNEGFGLVGSQ
jgi:hypothetical protein